MNKKFILSLDGVPHSLLKKMFTLGIMPNFKKLAMGSAVKKMKSVLPPVSSAAWASFATGVHPVEHGIMGFLERNPATLDWAIPNYNDLKAETIWEKLSRDGKRVFIMNVPLTSPAPSINGIAICGFLGEDILKGTYPKEIGVFLKDNGYIIDADIELGKRDLEKFIFHLYEVMEKRFEMMWHFWKEETWDFFMVHIMETDRLHHLLWEYMELGDVYYSELFYELYRKIDIQIGKIAEAIKGDTNFVLLSDHGFTTLKKEVYLNRWLWENNFLKFRKPNPHNLHDLHPSSKAYSLYPGRIYINLRGREINGSVNSGVEYNSLINELKKVLFRLSDPDSGQQIVKEIVTGDELNSLHGEKRFSLIEDDKLANHVPDLLIIPHKGYDFKGQLWNFRVFDKTKFNGTHTFDDAFIFSRGTEIPDCLNSIADVRRCLFAI